MVVEDINKFIDDFKDSIENRKTNLTPDLLNLLLYTAVSADLQYTSWYELLDTIGGEWYNN